MSFVCTVPCFIYIINQTSKIILIKRKLTTDILIIQNKIRTFKTNFLNVSLFLNVLIILHYRNKLFVFIFNRTTDLHFK